MKKVQKSRDVIQGEIPKYKYGVPCILCLYMIASQFVAGMAGKTTLLAIASFAVIAWFIGERIFPDKRYVEENKKLSKWVYMPGMIFLAMAVISQILAKGYEDGLENGQTDNIWTLICYVILFYMAYRYFHMEKVQKLLQYTVFLLAALVSIMSLLEFFDVPIAVLWLGSAEYLEEYNRVVLTFGNSNYYGAFCCMLVPVLMEYWIWEEDKKKKILAMLLQVLLMICVFLSKSSTALYLMVFAVLAVLLYEIKAIWKQLWMSVGMVLLLFVLVLVMNGLSQGKLFSLMSVSASNSDAFVEKEQKLYEIEDITFDENRLIITGTDSSFIVNKEENLSFHDEDGNILKMETQENVISFVEEPYDAISVILTVDTSVNKLCVSIDAGYKDTIDFYLVDNEFKGIAADGSEVDNIGGGYVHNPVYSMFTGRGYIWLRTLGLLDETMLLGKGCGNFIHVFPQYDYVGLLKYQGTHKILIDRPHNMLLQYGIEVGLLGTVSLCIMLGYVLLSSIKHHMLCGEHNGKKNIGYILAGVAFLGFMMLNDSMVIVSPYFWIFLGAVACL